MNILKNGDFDEDKSGWELVRSGTGEVAVNGEVTVRNDGKGKAMRIAPEYSDRRIGRVRLTQPFTAREGGYYDLRWWARAKQPTTVLVKLCEPEEPFRILRGLRCQVGRQWKEFSLRAYNTDRKRKESWSKAIRCQVQFDFQVSEENVIWVDDVKLQEDWLE